MDMIYKTIKGEVSKEDDGSLNLFIPLSSKEWDRSEEVVEPGAFKKTLPKFMKHPVLVASHDYGDLLNQIGEWTKLKITENGLEGKPKYYTNQGNPTADWAYNLASKNRAAFSVGFVPKEWEDGDGEKKPRKTYKEVELLEISHCIIPSNREACMGMMAKSVSPVVKSLCEEVLKELPEEVTKPEITDNTIRIPVDSGNHEGHKMRTIEISAKDGISALYCVNDKKVLTYIFSKEKWDMERAKKWVAEHKSFNVEHEVSQNEILDEIDYLSLMLEESGASDKVGKSLEEILVKYIKPKEAIQPATTAVKLNNIETKEELKIEIKEPTQEEILDEIKNIKMEVN